MTKGKWTAEIKGPTAEEYISKYLDLLPGGKVQTFIDDEFARLTDPFVPSDTTYTRKSVFELTDFGSGIVRYALYYPGMYTNVTPEFQDAPMRGAWWAHRMWNNGGAEKIHEGVRRLLGGRP